MTQIKTQKTLDSRGRALLLAAAIAAVLALQLAFNYFTPYAADDYIRASEVSRIEGSLLSGIIQDRLAAYTRWDARVIAHSLVYLFLSCDKSVFNILNALVYTAVTALMYFAAKPRGGPRPALYALCAALLWVFTKGIGQSTLWLTGSCNYLWAMLFILAFLLPYINLAKNGGAGGKQRAAPPKAVGMALLGLLAGWYIENASAAAVFIPLCFVLWSAKHKRKLPVWCYSGLAGVIAGFLFLVLAPGNFNRASMFKSYSLPVELASRIAMAFNQFSSLAVPFALLVLIIGVRFARGEREQLAAPVLLALGALAACFSMAASPTFPDRAMLASSVFVCTALACAAAPLRIMESYGKAARVSLAVAALLLSADVGFAALDIACTKKVSDARGAEAEAFAVHSAEGEIFETCSIEPLTRHNALYGLDDLSADAGASGNSAFSDYYHVNAAAYFPAYDNWGSVMSILLGGDGGWAAQE